MGTKKTDPDASVSDFYYAADLTIDPPLPDSRVKAVSNDWIKLQQIKDEDVQVVNGEIVVVSQNVTGIKQQHKPDEYAYGYTDFKKGLVALAKEAQSNGSELKGQVVIKDANTDRFYRLRVDNNAVVAEAALLGWPDGTQTPFPDNGAA